MLHSHRRRFIVLIPFCDIGELFARFACQYVARRVCMHKKYERLKRSQLKEI